MKSGGGQGVGWHGSVNVRNQSPNLLTFKEPSKRLQQIDSARLGIDSWAQLSSYSNEKVKDTSLSRWDCLSKTNKLYMDLQL